MHGHHGHKRKPRFIQGAQRGAHVLAGRLVRQRKAAQRLSTCRTEQTAAAAAAV
jgi:hypothetical protein